MKIIESNIDTFKFNWNGTNYSIYDDSLVLALNFNNNSALGENSTYFVDGGKYGNNATCSGSTCPNWTSSGRFGGAYLFDGSDDFVNVTPSGSVSGAFTVEMWANVKDTSGQGNSAGTMLSTRSPSDNSFDMKFYTNNKIHGDIGSGGGWITTAADASFNYATNTWYHVAYSVNQTGYWIYVNGVQMGSGSYASNTPLLYDGTHQISIGRYSSSLERFNGTLDEIRIYNRSLSAQEIWLQYQSEFQKYNGTTYLFYSNVTNLTTSTYTYYGWANDTEGNSAYTTSFTASSPRYLVVGLSPNTVTLAAPVNNTVWTVSSMVNFTYNVTDSLSILYCNLSINGLVNQSNSTVVKNQNQSFNVSFADGSYTWNVNCTDSEGNNGFSGLFNLVVNTAPPILNFMAPTEENGTAISRNWTRVNVTVTAANLDTFKFDWNGTNYSIYDGSLVLALGFNNNSAIGENSSKFVDASMYGNSGSCNVSGSCPIYTSAGRFNGAYVFDGAGDYVTVQDSVSLRVSSALTIEAWVSGKAPAVLGNGSDGAVTISSVKNINNDAIAAGRTSPDGVASAVSAIGSSNATVYNATGFAAGDEALLIDLQGNSTNYANVGTFEILLIQSNTSNTIVFASQVTKLYGASASNSDLGGQKIVLQRVPHYTNVTIQNGGVLACSAWNGSVGGVIVFKANGSVTVNGGGLINATGSGFDGGLGGGTGAGYSGDAVKGEQGDSYSGAGGLNQAANGGGGGSGAGEGGVWDNWGCTGGGGAGYSSAGTNGPNIPHASGGTGGSSYGAGSLGSLYLGSGGAGGGAEDSGAGLGSKGGRGGAGGGIIYMIVSQFTINGGVTANGNVGGNGQSGSDYGGGGGAGGSGGTIRIYANNASLGSNLTNASAGSPGTGASNTESGTDGGNSSKGRIAVYYTGSISGSTNPASNTSMSLANVLGKSGSYGLNYDGAVATGVINGNSISANVSSVGWVHLAVSFNGTTQSVYVNGSLAASGSYSGSINSTSNNLYLGADSNNYFNGTIDEVRIYASALSAQDIWLQYQTEFQKYNSTSYLFYSNLTNLSNGVYTYYGWANDSAGNSAYTNTYTAASPRYLSIGSGPFVGTVAVSDPDGDAIQLSVNDDVNVSCNATVYDPNGWQDIALVNASLWNYANSSLYGQDDMNMHYSNASCSKIGGSGNNFTAVCGFVLHHEALPGTWDCAILGKDSFSNYATSTGNNSVDQLVALTVYEQGISFGVMSIGSNSSVANSTNVTNQGNVAIDIKVSGNADMSCTSGTLGIGNIGYNVSSGNYDSMSSKMLSTTPTLEPAFNLGIEGAATPEGVPSTKNEYWTLRVPQGVGGFCNNTITVMAVIDEESTGLDFYVQNSAGSNVAYFSERGSLLIKGTCASASCASPPDGSFIVQNSTGAAVSYIDSSGNLCIQGASCAVSNATCTSPSDGSFIIQNSAGTDVAYINSTGGLCLNGDMTQNAAI